MDVCVKATISTQDKSQPWAVASGPVGGGAWEDHSAGEALGVIRLSHWSKPTACAAFPPEGELGQVG